VSHHLRALVSLCLATIWTGCGDDGSQAEAGETTPPPPATTAAPGTTTTATTDGSSTTGPAPSGCDCAAGEFCAAPHQTGVVDPDDEALVYACRAECVPAEDPSVWCRADVASCCPDLACDEHGFCVDPNAVDTTSGSGSSGTGTGTGGATDTDGGTTAGAESSSGSDSSSSGSSSSG
jgi:hypothetical protein